MKIVHPAGLSSEYLWYEQNTFVDNMSLIPSAVHDIQQCNEDTQEMVVGPDMDENVS